MANPYPSIEDILSEPQQEDYYTENYNPFGLTTHPDYEGPQLPNNLTAAQWNEYYNSPAMQALHSGSDLSAPPPTSPNEVMVNLKRSGIGQPQGGNPLQGGSTYGVNIGAGGQPMPSFDPYKKTTTKKGYTSPEIPARKSKEIMSRQDEILQYVKGKDAERKKAYQEAIDYFKKSSKKENIGLVQEKAYVDQRIKDLEREVGAGVTDPFNNMPIASKVASMISVAVGSIGSALQGGKQTNMAFAMFNKAMERDLSIQKENLNKSFQMLQLNVNTRKAINARIDKMQDQQRADAQKALELKILMSAKDKDTMGAMQNAADMSFKLAKATTPKITKETTTTTESGGIPMAASGATSMKGLKAGKGIKGYLMSPDFDKEEKKALVGALASVGNLGKFFKLIKGYKGKDKDSSYMDYAKAKIPGVKDFTRAGAIQAYGEAISLSMAAAANLGKPTNDDRAAIKGMIANVGNSMKDVVFKMNETRDYAINKAESNMEFARQTGDMVKYSAFKEAIEKLKAVRFE